MSGDRTINAVATINALGFPILLLRMRPNKVVAACIFAGAISTSLGQTLSSCPIQLAGETRPVECLCDSAGTVISCSLRTGAPMCNLAAHGYAIINSNGTYEIFTNPAAFPPQCPLDYETLGTATYYDFINSAECCPTDGNALRMWWCDTECVTDAQSKYYEVCNTFQLANLGPACRRPATGSAQ